MNLKRIGSIILSVVVLGSLLVGCSKESKDNASVTTVAQTQNAKEMVTFSLIYPGDPAETKLAQEVYKKLEEKLKTKVDLQYAPAANYAERIQIIMAGGDLPDVVRFLDVNDIILKANAESGNFVDVSKNLKNAVNLMKWTLPESFKATAFKGKDSVFLIPVTTLIRSDGFSIRQDWLDKVGIKVDDGKPITIDQFKDIIKKFTMNDPDGNGADDTFGFNVCANPDGQLVPLYTPNSILDPIAGSFGLIGWQKASGEAYDYMDPKLSQKSDKFKKYLDFLADCYRNKYFDPNWGVLKSVQFDDTFAKGRVGMQSQFPGHVLPSEQAIQKVNPNAKLTWLSGIINPEAGKVTGVAYSAGAYGGFAITKKCKNTDRVIEWFDYQLSDEIYPNVSVYGGEGVGYTTQNGKRVPTDAYNDKIPNIGGIGGMGRFPIMRRANDPYAFLSLNLSEEAFTKAKGWLETAVANAVISKDMGYLPKAAIEPKFRDYQKKMIEVVTKIVLGTLPSSAYDKALADWYKNGGDAYVKEMNDYIKSLSN